jgi:hypothetical protein
MAEPNPKKPRAIKDPTEDGNRRPQALGHGTRQIPKPESQNPSAMGPRPNQLGISFDSKRGQASIGPGWVAIRSDGKRQPIYPSQLTGISGWNGAHNSALAKSIRRRGDGK